MVFMNYIAALKLTRKIILVQFLSDCGVKIRPCKTKVLIWKFSPIIHTIIYYNQSAKKRFLRRKSYWGSWNYWGSSVIGSSLTSLLILFSLTSSVILFSLGFSVIGSFLQSDGLFKRVLSWVISPLFPVCWYFFIKRCYHFFLLKQIFCLHYIFKKTFTSNN